MQALATDPIALAARVGGLRDVTFVAVIIVTGWLEVGAEQRDSYLSDCLAIIEAARRAQGCIDFHLSADPIDPDRINVFEQWENVEAVDRFRDSGPSGDQQDSIIAAHVQQHEIASTTSLT